MFSGLPPKADITLRTRHVRFVPIAETMTPKRFFELFEANSALPKFWFEVSHDMEDVIDFYHLSFLELRMGETKSSRLLQMST